MVGAELFVAVEEGLMGWSRVLCLWMRGGMWERGERCHRVEAFLGGVRGAASMIRHVRHDSILEMKT